MTGYNRFALLPDLDVAPAVYETPAVPQEQDTTRRQSTSHSIASSENNDVFVDIDDTSTSGIVRQQLRPGRARQTFNRARVDARDVDFSDRLDGRRSYHVKSGRSEGSRRFGVNGRIVGDGEAKDGGSDEEEEQESLEVRIARLLREVEEVKGEVARTSRSDENRAVDGNQNGDAGGAMETVTKLSGVLQDLQLQGQTTTLNSAQQETYISTNVQSVQGLQQTTTEEQSHQQPAQYPTPATLATPTNRTTNPDVILSKATALESRLASLEGILGPPSDIHTVASASSTSPTAISNSSASTSHDRNILTHLTHLDRLLTSLNSTTAPTLSSLSEQITQLTTSADRLTKKRHEAAVAADDALAARARMKGMRYMARLLPRGAGLRTLPSAVLDSDSKETAQQEPAAPVHDIDADLDLSFKISALHAALPMIESTSPLLPLVVERLRTLRLLHTDAATAEGRLKDVETRQGVLGKELADWKSVLERVEKGMEEGEERLTGNRDVVEGWVRQLEERMGRLS